MAVVDHAVLDTLRGQIQPDALAEQGFPRPKRVSLLETRDSEGEEAFRIYIVFSDDTPDQTLALKNIEPMISWVRDLVWQGTGQQRWPYVRVKREKDILAELS